jgi:hypothetical protein
MKPRLLVPKAVNRRLVALPKIVAVVLRRLVPIHPFRAARPHPRSRAIHFARVLHLLLAVRHDDAIVVLSVLQIVLSQYRITRRLGIARKRQVLLGDVRRRATNLNVWSV